MSSWLSPQHSWTLTTTLLGRSPHLRDRRCSFKKGHPSLSHTCPAKSSPSQSPGQPGVTKYDIWSVDVSRRTVHLPGGAPQPPRMAEPQTASLDPRAQWGRRLLAPGGCGRGLSSSSSSDLWVTG